MIGENRRQYHLGEVGSRDWWKGVDSVSQRRNSAHIMLDHESLENLNDYFCKLCTDDNYVRPSDVQICTDVEVPTISERQVWDALSNLKRTATGPGRIPFWIWREHAELLTPVITHIWNLSFCQLTPDRNRGKGPILTHCLRLMYAEKTMIFVESVSRQLSSEL